MDCFRGFFFYLYKPVTNYKENFTFKYEGGSLVLSRQLHRCSNEGALDPFFISGLTDGLGSSCLAINPEPKRTTGYGILVSFELALNIKDLHLLEEMKSYFGVGNIYKHSDIR